MGPRVVTLYEKQLSKNAANFTKISEPLSYVKNLDPENPETGRYIIESTYQTFCNQALTLVEERRLQRQIQEKIPEGERKSNFDPSDFDLVWDYPLERLVIDEGHNAKNPYTRTNAALCRLEDLRNFWFISATPIDNAAEDVLGMTKLMKGLLERADLVTLLTMALRCSSLLSPTTTSSLMKIVSAPYCYNYQAGR